MTARPAAWCVYLPLHPRSASINLEDYGSVPTDICIALHATTSWHSTLAMDASLIPSCICHGSMARPSSSFHLHYSRIKFASRCHDRLDFRSVQRCLNFSPDCAPPVNGLPRSSSALSPSLSPAAHEQRTKLEPLSG